MTLLASFTVVPTLAMPQSLPKTTAGIEKGATNALTETVGKLNRKQVREIAEIKRPDMNTKDMDAIMRQIEGTARQMGVEVVE